MPNNVKKVDLRIKKTNRALSTAMSALLEHRNFVHLTVNDLCNEALISRSSFYTHFNDKYDLLRAWLRHLQPDILKKGDTYEETEEKVNQLIHNNEAILKNLICNADKETLGILSDYMLATLNLTINKYDSNKLNPQYAVLTNFYAGGMVHYLLWQVENNFPSEVAPMNKYLYDIIKRFQEWQTFS